MSAIMRGTTPEIEISIDTDDFYLSNVTEMELYVTNGANTVTYTMDDLTIDTANNTITKGFSEEETIALNARFPVIIQGRCWLVGGAVVGIEKQVYEVKDMEGV